MQLNKKREINNFDYFKIGTVFNTIKPSKKPKVYARKITVEYPTRLNAMAIDPSRITENNNMIYNPGEIVFSTEIFQEVTVELIEEDEIIIDNNYLNKDTVIKHTCLIMKKAMNYDGGFRVSVNNYHGYRHCGLGSTGSLQASIGVCINELFAKPFTKSELLKYLARNYGEEIDNNELELNPVQCIGGSLASGLYAGGVLVLAGNNVVISYGEISNNYTVLIGIPEGYKVYDSVTQFNDEKQNLDKFLKTGNKFKEQIAYNVLHYFLPSVIESDISTMGDVIFDYRYNMGSIKNCSYTYPNIVELMDNIAFLKLENHVEVLSISSVGPAVFAIVSDSKAEYCEEVFKQNGLNIIETKIYNDSYRVGEIEFYE